MADEELNSNISSPAIQGETGSVGFRNVNISASASSTPSEDLTVAAGPSADNTSGNPLPRNLAPNTESAGSNLLRRNASPLNSSSLIGPSRGIQDSFSPITYSQMSRPLGNFSAVIRPVQLRPGSNPVPVPNEIPQRNRYRSRGSSEYIRRPSSESEGQNSNSPVQTGSSLQQVSASSGAGLRSALTSETQLLNAPGGTSSWPSAAGGLEWRIVPEDEYQSVLDPMRRGEGLRMEDMAILDQSIFTEMVEMILNDGHRDMRLDVDNMSDDEDMPNLEQSIFTELAEILDAHRDMRLDIDNMSYEELLALEEGLGDVDTGLSDETIENQLKHRKFSSDPCCICQENYNDGDDIGAVECGHEFHSECIKQWLKLKNSCPICKAPALKN